MLIHLVVSHYFLDVANYKHTYNEFSGVFFVVGGEQELHCARPAAPDSLGRPSIFLRASFAGDTAPRKHLLISTVPALLAINRPRPTLPVHYIKSGLRGDCKPYPHNVNFSNIFLRN